MKFENEKINIVDVLVIVFVTLKLCHLIEWSWLWVLSPLWIEFIITAIFTITITILKK